MKNNTAVVGPDPICDLSRFNLFVQLFVRAEPAPRRRVARRR